MSFISPLKVVPITIFFIIKITMSIPRTYFYQTIALSHNALEVRTKSDYDKPFNCFVNEKYIPMYAFMSI